MALPPYWSRYFLWTRVMRSMERAVEETKQGL